MCKEDEFSRCFGMDCQCSKGFLLPAESKTLPLKGPRFAIVLAGMTRSFFSKLMNEFWRLFLARFDGDLVLFAVWTTISKQKLKGTGLSARKDQAKPERVKNSNTLDWLLKLFCDQVYLENVD